MQYRVDPKSGNKLSILGLGCMRFGGNNLVKSFSGRFDREKAEKLIVAAVEKGINYFDTAYIYMGSEEILGQTLEKHHLRDQVYIATKLPLFMLKKEEDIEKYFTEELKRLRTDHIDYYLMHMLPDLQEWEKLCSWNIVQWIKEKKESGQIRQVGFSFHGACKDFLEVLNVYDWDFCQIQFNYSDENFQAGITGLKAANEKGIPVMIMEPLLGGKLVNGLPKEAIRRFQKTEPERSAAEWGLRWVWNHPEVTLLLSGMNEMEQLDENTSYADRAFPDMLTEEENVAYEDVKQIFEDSYKVHCTGCHYCMPCPAGVNIPGCFSAYNTSYAISKGTGNLQYMMTTLLGNNPCYASLCKKCGKCEKHCPQHLEIRKELEQVSKEMEHSRFQMMKLGMSALQKVKKYFNGRKNKESGDETITMITTDTKEAEAICARHSVRSYIDKPIESEVRYELGWFVKEMNEESGLNITIQYDDPAGFDSKMAHYGKFKNVKNYIVLKGKDCSDFEERCGYYGEKIVLKCQMLGLNTCWVALTFNKRLVKKMIPDDERFCMVIALGYGENQGVSHKGKSYKDVVVTKGNAPEWFKNGVEAALLAPTAMNQQKFVIGMQNKKPAIKVSGKGFFTKTDLGIVKCHFEVGSGVEL